jgi:hypothetical protein
LCESIRTLSRVLADLTGKRKDVLTILGNSKQKQFKNSLDPLHTKTLSLNSPEKDTQALK